MAEEEEPEWLKEARRREADADAKSREVIKKEFDDVMKKDQT